ncbi:hypothetical protein BDW27_101398 [Nocardiopsis sp. L17-MgMaSL7]|nr:hypothetical protein BDW27_101398 [Nocardiopsis sp. L17-MgMaSL7]
MLRSRSVAIPQSDSPMWLSAALGVVIGGVRIGWGGRSVPSFVGGLVSKVIAWRKPDTLGAQVSTGRGLRRTPCRGSQRRVAWRCAPYRGRSGVSSRRLLVATGMASWGFSDPKGNIVGCLVPWGNCPVSPRGGASEGVDAGGSPRGHRVPVSRTSGPRGVTGPAGIGPSVGPGCTSEAAFSSRFPKKYTSALPSALPSELRMDASRNHGGVAQGKAGVCGVRLAPPSRSVAVGVPSRGWEGKREIHRYEA